MFVDSFSYNDSVFINCPFDDDYTPLFYAIVYTVYRCGFAPQCALSEDDGTDFRLDKIVRNIEKCRLGIHDISRIEMNDSGLPRFNMPFELGIFFGAKRFGQPPHNHKNALILERTRYMYQQYISDLNGIDTKAHNNDVNIAIEKVRNWLNVASGRENIPGHRQIQSEFRKLNQLLPHVVENDGLDPKNIPFNDYCGIVEAFIMEVTSVVVP